MAVPVSAVCVFLLGETMTSMPSNLSIASLIFQTAWVAFITFLIWFGLVQRYSANRLAALTFLTPLFGVAAGYLILDEPLSAGFLIAVAMVTIGTLAAAASRWTRGAAPCPRAAIVATLRSAAAIACGTALPRAPRAVQAQNK